MKGVRTMYRCIKLNKPIQQRLLNGNTINYNSLIITNANGYTEVRVSRYGGIADYNEIILTSKDLDKRTPEGYIAVRPNMETVQKILPKLEDQGVLVRHPLKKFVRISFVEAPLYKVNILPKPIKTVPAPHMIAVAQS